MYWCCHNNRCSRHSKLFVTGFRQKNPYKDVIFFLQMRIRSLYCMKLNVKKKMSLKRMMYTLILNIKCSYFIYNSQMHICKFILVLRSCQFLFPCIAMLPMSSCLSNFKITWFPHVSNSKKDCFKFYNLFFTNGRRAH